MRIWRNGRRVGLRIQWATVQVQVLLSAPNKHLPERVGVFRCVKITGLGCHLTGLQRRTKVSWGSLFIGYGCTLGYFALGKTLFITNYFCGHKSVFAVLNTTHSTASTISGVCLAKTKPVGDFFTAKMLRT